MSTQQDKLREIADAIRSKDGTTEPIIANDFAERIRKLNVLPFVKPLDQCTPQEISQISKAGLAPSYFAVGDETAEINMNGFVSDGLTLDNFKIRAFIVGFDHNQSVESPGEHVTHFQLGKVNGTLVGFYDSGYNGQKTSGQWLNMNNANSNSGGWESSLMRKDILGGDTTPNNPQQNSLIAALPQEWRAVMRSVKKYTDNTGGGSNNAAYVTATDEYVCLPAEFEYFGARTDANSKEQDFQQHYTYYASANQRIHYRYDQTNTAVVTWTRSVIATNRNTFRTVNTSGNAGSNFANYSNAVAPLLFI